MGLEPSYIFRNKIKVAIFYIRCRLLRGGDAGLITSAGATYVHAGQWALALNLIVGSGLAIGALRVLHKPFTWHGGIGLSASLTFALLFASPLLSAQFLLWPTVFLSLVATAGTRRLLIGASAATIILLTVWAPGNLGWHVGWLTRNLLLLTAAVFTVRHGVRVAGDSSHALKT